LSKSFGRGFNALCLATLLAATAANAQFQLQRLYTTASGLAQSPCFIIEGHDGNFYGTIISGSSGNVFKMTPNGVVTTFSTVAGLNAELAPTDDGNFYGTTAPNPGSGSVIKITTIGQITTVFTFTGVNGGRPSGMRKGLDGCYYGVTTGTNGLRFPVSDFATIFQFTTNNALRTLHSVTNTSDFTGLPVQGTDGFLYGTATTKTVGGPPLGSSFRISFYRLSTNGTYQNIFTRSNAPGPAGDLIFGSDGNLYGPIGSHTQPSLLTYGGIFRISTNGVFTNLVTFNSVNGSDPEGRLLLASDGYLYGTTFGATGAKSGTVFRMTGDGDLTTLIHFGGTNGSNPLSPIIEATDGNFYGTTDGSTFTGPGTIFRLVQPIISSVAISNGVATLRWNSFIGGIYRVEYKSDLSDVTWNSLTGNIIATDVTTTLFDNLTTDSQRVYRVVLLP
jgi:hypothetical protein